MHSSSQFIGIPLLFDGVLLYTRGSSDSILPTMVSFSTLNLYPSVHQHLHKTLELFHSIFCEIHSSNLVDSHEYSDESQFTSEFSLLDFSIRYRSAIQNDEFDIQASNTSISVQHLIWHLSEILYLTPEQPGPKNSGKVHLLSMKLANWVKLHHSREPSFFGMNDKTKLVLTEILKELYIFILQGRVDESVQLLNLILSHREYFPCLQDREFAVIQTFYNMIKIWPFHNHDKSSGDLHSMWVSWTEYCREIVDLGQLQSIFEIEQLGRLMCGDRQSFVSIPLYSCPRWIDMLVGMVLYCNPFVEAFSTDLMELVHFAYLSFNASSFVDKLLLNLFTSSLLDFFQLLCKVEPSWCIAAHLADLFTLAGYQDLTYQLYPDVVSSECKRVRLNEHIILGYASSLIKTSQHWIRAVDYFVYSCPSFGGNVLKTHLERIGANSDEEISTKVVAICEKYRFTSIISSTSKIQARHCLSLGDIPRAANWCRISGDDRFSNYLVRKYVRCSIMEGNLQHIFGANQCPLNAFLGEEFSFLLKYSEFLSLYSAGNIWSSAKLVTSIIRSEVAPKEFWMPLFFDVLPLLDLEECLFSEEDTYEMMRVLQDLSFKFTSEKHIPGLVPNAVENMFFATSLEFLRKALTRALSKPLISD